MQKNTGETEKKWLRDGKTATERERDKALERKRESKLGRERQSSLTLVIPRLAGWLAVSSVL